jgi:hypothetical protein
MREVASVEQTINGLLVRDRQGRLMPGTRPANLITTENARQMRRRDLALNRQAAAAGMSAGVRAAVRSNPGLVEDMELESTGDTTRDAWALVNAVTTAQVMQSDIPRPDAVELLGKHTGMTPTRDDADEQPHRDVDAVLVLLAYARRDVIDIPPTGDGFDN